MMVSFTVRATSQLNRRGPDRGRLLLPLPSLLSSPPSSPRPWPRQQEQQRQRQEQQHQLFKQYSEFQAKTEKCQEATKAKKDKYQSQSSG